METSKTKGIALTALISLSLAHLLNDMMQSVLFASYPVLKTSLALNFTQIGLITLVYQVSASIFQPFFGYIFDKRPRVWVLPAGMLSTMLGLLLLSIAPNLGFAMFAVFFSGIGSSVLHPEASRLTSLASNGRRGLAQSIFQVGGTAGFSFGPILAALFISPYGQKNIAYFSFVALFAILVTIPICKWYAKKLKNAPEKNLTNTKRKGLGLSRKRIAFTLAILFLLVFSKYVYQASFSSYYIFYLQHKFGLEEEKAQMFLFAFLFASALGTLFGGPIGDRVGRRYVIWFSILGAAPFALAMPHAGLWGTLVLSIFASLIISSAFSAILVYAQEILPMKLGLVSGLFFGLAFGVAGISSSVLGKIADAHSIEFVYLICSFMPLMGAIAYFLPRVRTLQAESAEQLKAKML